MVTIISRETIKPSSQSTQHLNPYKLCLFDQIIRLTYSTSVLFYPNIIGPESNFSFCITRMKKSLSETLNLYYPFSGRIRNDNIYVDNFDAGVPFLEARVECRMSEYFKSNDGELLNKLLPFHPGRKETNEPKPIPLLAFQASIFACGGLALGFSVCHRLADAASMNYMLSLWTALCRGSSDQVETPNFSDSALLFPPINDFPENISALLDKMCFKEGNYVTRTFFFSAKAVEALRDKARASEDLPKPTRNEAVTSFIWKHVIEASWAVSGSRNVVSIANHVVNIRPKLKLQNPMGNLIWYATAVANTREGTELPKLVGHLKEAMEEYESVFRSISERSYEEGSASEKIQNKFQQLVSISQKVDNDTKLESVRFSNWKGFYNGVDFGWGKPFVVRIMGNIGPNFSNTVFLVDAQWGKGIEATVTLEEKLMAVLERDVDFMAFVSANPL